jgi:hypothetical protein
MASGMEMMMVNLLKGMGIDPKALMAKFDETITMIQNEQKALHTKLDAQQAQLDRIEKRQEEIWQKNQVALSRSSQIQLVPQPTQPPQQPEQQPEHNLNPSTPPMPQQPPLPVQNV